MIIKSLLRKLNYEISKRESTRDFVEAEFYFPSEEDEIDNLEVGETQVSITAQFRTE